MTSVLITGGAGFIGSHTTKKLLDRGYDVYVYDYFHQYIFPMRESFIANMNYRFNHLLAGAEVLRGSTDDKDDLRRNILSIKPTYIIHLAALPLANIAVRRSEEAFAGIIEGTVNLLEILRDVDFVDNFVYVSSSMAYGDFTQSPMPEDGEMNPKDVYGGMKYAGEIMVQVYSHRYDVPYTIVRPSAVYGPTDNNRRVLQIFVESAIDGEPITVSEPDATVLDFTFVEDVAEGLTLAALSSNSVGEAFNMTYGEGRSLREAVTILQGFFPGLEVHESRNSESFRPKRGALDISKAQKLLGYKPGYPLESGLEKYVEFVRSQNKQ